MLAIAGAVYLACIVSPPALMDDVDAVQAQIARTMLATGDWVTARLDGVVYLEKAPLVYWAIAGSYAIFGVHDWAARLPIALSAMALAWLTAVFGSWAFPGRAGFNAGLCIATSLGLFLFTRILIPDVMLTLSVTLALWALVRALDEGERQPRFWASVLAVSLAAGFLLKSLVGVVFPLATGLVYLFLTHALFEPATWRRLRPLSGGLIFAAIVLPWHVLATVRNPPYFAWTLASGPGQYHGFLWFFFVNEQLLRFLNLRYPRDYNTVPRLYFWLLHLVWLFPWSVWAPAVAGLSFRPIDRAGRTRLLALCWIAVVLVFFTFSTTQEYYSMPCYPALALLLGSAMEEGGAWIRRGSRALCLLAVGGALTSAVLLALVRHLPAPGDISYALVRHPGAYTLSLGHLGDLTIQSLAYLRLPLLVTLGACLVGALGTFRAPPRRAFLTAACMMIVFFQAARLALVAFDPYLGSRGLAEALRNAPAGTLIVDHHYYTFSSVFFYADRPALLLNGRFNNLEYGAYAPGVPPVFIDDAEFARRWRLPERHYLIATDSALPRLQGLVGRDRLHVAAASGGKVVLTNQPLPGFRSAIL